MQNPLIDIVVVNGGGEIFDNLYEDIMHRVEYENFRLIIVAQERERHGKSFRDHYCSRGPSDDVKIIYSEENMLPPIPYNDAIEYAQSIFPLSRFTLLLDDDIIIKDFNFLRNILTFWEIYKSGIICSAHCLVDETKMKMYDVENHVKNCLWFIDNRLFKTVGYFDEEYEGKFACYDYCQRTILSGGKISVIPGSMHWFDHVGNVGFKKSGAKIQDHKVKEKNIDDVYVGHRKKNFDQTRAYINPAMTESNIMAIIERLKKK